MLVLVLILFLAHRSFHVWAIKLPADVIELAKLTTPEIIKKHGYPSEIHHVTTEDGYILAMHRMRREGAQPFFLQHGLLDTSATFVLMGPEIGLAYLLWDMGYDVWLGNTRGNRYSRNHSNLDPNEREFWQYSWDEIGYHDIPAMIDYILNITNFKKLFYTGHSQGTTVFWVMCSRKPAYNEKIIFMQALAPVAFMSHIKTPVYKRLGGLGEVGIRALGEHEFFPHGKLITSCFQEDERLQKMMIDIFFMIVGRDEKEFNKTMWPAMCNYLPAGAATNQVVHYYQLIRSGRFCKYDFGPRKNQEKYGARIPPKYDVSKVTAPVALYYSDNDFLTAAVDVEHLYTQLGNPVEKYLVPMDQFNHIDFVWGINVRKMVYERFLQVMQNFSTNGDQNRHV